MSEIKKQKCDCSKLLVVDDNDANIFVLQGYSKIQKICCDTVFFCITIFN